MLVLKILLTAISTLLFLYILWKKLKDDYANYVIFTCGFYCIFAIAIGSLISINFFPEWWFWVSFGSGFLGILAGVIRYHLRFFETVDAAALGGLILLLTFFLYKRIGIFSALELFFPALKIFLAASVSAVALYLPLKLLDQLVLETELIFQ